MLKPLLQFLQVLALPCSLFIELGPGLEKKLLGLDLRFLEQVIGLPLGAINSLLCFAFFSFVCGCLKDYADDEANGEPDNQYDEPDDNVIV